MGALMRLPAVTQRQLEHENSRERHERWYAAYLASEPVIYPTSPGACVIDQNFYSSNGRRFWAERGFRIRTRTNLEKTTLTVWLEARPAQTSEAA